MLLLFTFWTCFPAYIRLSVTFVSIGHIIEIFLERHGIVNLICLKQGGMYYLSSGLSVGFSFDFLPIKMEVYFSLWNNTINKFYHSPWKDWLDPHYSLMAEYLTFKVIKILRTVCRKIRTNLNLPATLHLFLILRLMCGVSIILLGKPFLF